MKIKISLNEIILLLIILAFHCKLTFAQTVNIDSLKSASQSEIDIFKKGELVYRVFVYYFNNDITIAKEYSEKIYTLAKTAKNDSILCRYYQSKSLIASKTGDAKTEKYYDEMFLQTAINIKYHKYIGMGYLNKGAALDRSNSKAALAYYNKAFPESILAKDTMNIGLAMMNIGVVYSNNGNNKKALENMEEAYMLLSKYKKSANYLLMAMNYYVFALHRSDSKNPRILPLIDSVLTLSQSAQNKTIELKALDLLSEIYFENNNLSKANEVNHRMYNISLDMEDTYYQATSLINLAETNSILTNNDSCFYYINKAQKICVANNYTDLQIKCFAGLGNFYKASNKLVDAKKYLLKANDLSIKQNAHNAFYMVILTRLTDLYTGLGQIDSAKYFSNLSIEEGAKHPNEKFLKKVALFSAKITSFTDSGSALQVYDSLFRAIDTTDQIMQAKSMEEILQKYNVRESQLIASTKQKEINTKNKIVIGTFIFSSVLLSLLAILFRLFRKLKKQQYELQIEKNNVVVLNENIKHGVKNQFIELNNILGINNADTIKTINNLKSRTNAYISLYEIVFSSRQKDVLSLHELIVLIFNRNCSGLKVIPSLQIEGEVNLNLLQLDLLPWIINEMVVNSIEHAFKDIENPGIKFKLKKENNEITIEYFDNGIGYTFNTSKFIKNTGFLYFYSGITQTLKGTFKQISSPQGIHLIIQFTDGKKKSTFSRR